MRHDRDIRAGVGRRRRTAAALLVSLWAVPLWAQTATAPPLAVETFDAAWRIVYETHFDTTFNGVDWVALRDEYRPKAEAAQSLGELRELIERMLERLGQSHFDLIPKELVDTLDAADPDTREQVGDAGLDVRFLDGQVVVTRVDSGGPAWAVGVRPGWVVAVVGGDSVAALVRSVRDSESRYGDGIRIWGRVMRRLQGSPGATREVQFLDAHDTPRTVSLTLRRDPGEPVKFGNLPTFFSRFAQREIVREDAGITVGVVWFNHWMVPLMRQLDQAMDEFRGRDGIVIDLRGNGGGVGGMVMGVAGHFLDQRIALGTMRTRTVELRIVANPRRTDGAGRTVSPIGQPVAVLTDELTGSASEVFAGGMQAIGRVRVFGDASMGAVLPARMSRLPNDDVLYHAFADFTTAEGTLLEGRGVIPDERVIVARQDLLAGRDPVLDASIRWIAAERRRGAIR